MKTIVLKIKVRNKIIKITEMYEGNI